MEEMLKVLVRDIVDNPDAINVTTRVEDKVNVLELRVDPSDMGKVIGKQGKIAKAIRTLMKAYATKNGTKINVEIID
ncbi:MAG: KH domain-containing protein [Clostridia bacterium]|nr:KH domain-containing protein [Clostridia bacterium]MBR4111071.1 KH domain-containing protein [Clostridia bacterium]